MDKTIFLKAMENVNLSQEAENRILRKALGFKRKKESVFMSKRKIGIIAAAAVMVLGFTVYAASGIITGMSSSSSGKPEFTEFPTQKEVIAELGYSAVLIDEFENGYKFKNASVLNSSLDSENGSIEKYKSIMMRYEKDGQEVLIDQSRFYTDMPLTDEIAATIDGIDIHYGSYLNKVVPPDYELTEEDKKLEEAGELVFTYGSDKVFEQTVAGAGWYEDGMLFNITLINNDMNAEEVIKMAEELISK